MFSLRDYIKKGFLDAVGKMSNYQIILNSAGWMEKGVLTEEDLTEINAAIEAWEAEQEKQNDLNTEVSDVLEEITTEDKTGAEMVEPEYTEGNLEEETDEPISNTEDGEPLT